MTEHYDVIIAGGGTGGGRLAHELDILYVVDTSYLPSIGAVKPTLATVANAIQVGEHRLGRMS